MVKLSWSSATTSKGAIAHVATKGYTTTTLKLADVVKRVRAGEQVESIDEASSSTEETVGDTETSAEQYSEPKKSIFGRG